MVTVAAQTVQLLKLASRARGEIREPKIRARDAMKAARHALALSHRSAQHARLRFLSPAKGPTVLRHVHPWENTPMLVAIATPAIQVAPHAVGLQQQSASAVAAQKRPSYTTALA